MHVNPLMYAMILKSTKDLETSTVACMRKPRVAVSTKRALVDVPVWVAVKNGTPFL